MTAVRANRNLRPLWRQPAGLPIVAALAEAHPFETGQRFAAYDSSADCASIPLGAGIYYLHRETRAGKPRSVLRSGGIMKKRTMLLVFPMCLVGAAVCFAADPQVGAWKLNEAKSKLRVLAKITTHN